jgi:hypothetical protein
MATTKQVKQQEMQLAWLNRQREKMGMPPLYVDFEMGGNANEMLPQLQQEYLNQLRAGGDPQMEPFQRQFTPENLMQMQQLLQQQDPGGGAIPGLTPEAMQGMQPQGGEQSEYEDAALALENYGFEASPHLIETYVQLRRKDVEPGDMFKLIKSLADAALPMLSRGNQCNYHHNNRRQNVS